MNEEVEAYLEIIDFLLDEGCFAEDFLISVRKWIVENNKITLKQQQAINNILKKFNEPSPEW